MFITWPQVIHFYYFRVYFWAYIELHCVLYTTLLKLMNIDNYETVFTYCIMHPSEILHTGNLGIRSCITTFQACALGPFSKCLTRYSTDPCCIHNLQSIFWGWMVSQKLNLSSVVFSPSMLLKTPCQTTLTECGMDSSLPKLCWGKTFLPMLSQSDDRLVNRTAPNEDEF